MKTNQINFFLMPEDINEINHYLHSNDFLIISQPMTSNSIVSLNSITEFNNDLEIKFSKKFLVLKQDINKLNIKFIKEQNYYLINEFNSPCIEVLFSPFNKDSNKKLNRGRFFFSKSFYDSEKNIQNKEDSFVNASLAFFKWVKKNFKNVKLKGFEDFLVSQRTLDWVNSGGMLLENYNFYKSSIDSQNLIKQKAIA
ncbi:MAG: hypothetical protein SFU98_13855 [Leptospiraceae bacterium]|nr:hypothetical protein [Leptospiraceae bacterium]